MRKKRKQCDFVLIAVVFLYTISNPIQAQKLKEKQFFNQASLVGRLHYGFLLAHREHVEHLVGHTDGFEISLSRQSTGEKMWHQYYRYPHSGFTYVFLDFNNPEKLGNAHAGMVFINIPVERNEGFQLSFRMASGIGYLTKKYERVENYKNNVIGSHLNAAIQLNLETRYKLSQHLYFNFNAGLTHFSNASFQTPNLGINNPSVNFGLTYQIDKTTPLIHSERLPYNKNIQVDVLYAAGIKETYPTTGKQYVAHSLSSTMMKQVGYKIRLGVGLDMFYDLSLVHAQRTENRHFTNNFEIVKSGIHFSNELMMGKLAVLFHMGMYLIDKYNLDGNIYHRLGYKYLINEHFFVNLTLKTHYGKADYAEWGVGWKFVKK